jgi:nucleoside-diphosphate-sugar epimerase
MRRCLVTGATGAVGPRLLQALHDGGWGIRVLARHPDRSAIAVPGAELLRGDITDTASLGPGMDGIDTVFHLASLLHVVNPPPSLRAEYERVNVAGTANVANAARSAGVRRLVFFSTIAVYGAYAGGHSARRTPASPRPITGGRSSRPSAWCSATREPMGHRWARCCGSPPCTAPASRATTRAW